MNTEITHIFEELKFLANAISELGLPEKVFEAAREQNPEKYELICEEFKKESPELWERLVKLYDEYVSTGYPEIFLDQEEPSEEDEDLFPYDSSEIHSQSLITIMIMSEGVIDETCLFMNNMELWDALEEQGQHELSEYIEDHIVETFDDLMGAFQR